MIGGARLWPLLVSLVLVLGRASGCDWVRSTFDLPDTLECSALVRQVGESPACAATSWSVGVDSCCQAFRDLHSPHPERGTAPCACWPHIRLAAEAAAPSWISRCDLPLFEALPEKGHPRRALLELVLRGAIDVGSVLPLVVDAEETAGIVAELLEDAGVARESGHVGGSQADKVLAEQVPGQAQAGPPPQPTPSPPSAASGSVVLTPTTSRMQRRQADVALDGTAGPVPRVYVGVLSACANQARREGIRASWGAHPLWARVRFFLELPTRDAIADEDGGEAGAGSPNATAPSPPSSSAPPGKVVDEAALAKIQEEQREKGDLVLLPSQREAYGNIVYQTLELLRFAAAAEELNVTHVLKVDDDSYVHAERLLQAVLFAQREFGVGASAGTEAASRGAAHLFLGHVEAGGEPNRDAKSQWYVDPLDWPPGRPFPAWAHGAGYVLSIGLAREAAAGAALMASRPERDRRLFPLEDVAVGSWVEWVARDRGWTVHALADARFNFAGCRSRDVVSHYVAAEAQACLWASGGDCRKCRAAENKWAGADPGGALRARLARLRKGRRRVDAGGGAQAA